MTEPPAAESKGGGSGPPGRIRPFLDEPSAAPEPFVEMETGPRALRPFVLTSGRVASSDPDIGLETQVTTRAGAITYGLTPELDAIVALCATPVSVAEISARLKLHLGVAKILVGDLRESGHLDVHAVDFATSHDPDTILRVMRGLRAIS